MRPRHVFKLLLAHPLTRALNIDDPNTTQLRRQIIREKRFLQQIYLEWYAALAEALPEGPGRVLELGSGAGFLNDLIHELITSDVFSYPGIRVVLDGEKLPFSNKVLRGILMIDVLHHFSRPRCFFTEAGRCIRPGGIIAMIEPWVTPWSRFIYTWLHHEPFCPEAKEWEFHLKGPLSSANGALPWILFKRDREQFEREYPIWEIQVIKPMMPFRYLIAGGISMRQLMPYWSFALWHKVENMLQPWMNNLAMFAFIVLRRRA